LFFYLRLAEKIVAAFFVVR